ncbi:MAG: glycosyltransferase family 2 protein [Candidatus Riflebacteria bacterium]|nr:glycosyltransferase family 2 protein [Candidatus Riflebacteria bacterium]
MNRNLTPIISVLMPVYNREEYIRESVESILNQSFRNFEFLIGDDGSTDSTPQIIRKYAEDDKRITLHIFEHRGQFHQLNKLVASARGKYIAMMESDDISLPERFERQLKFIQETDCDVCGGQVETFGARFSDLCYPETHEGICLEQLFRVAILQPATMMKSVVAKENPYLEDIFLVDYEWPIRISPRYRLSNSPALILKRRVHEKQTSTVNLTKCLKESANIRFKYFYSMFPNTPIEDFIAFTRIADKQPMTSIPELKRAGKWLVELSRCSEEKMKKIMQIRWKNACDFSVELGKETISIFNHYQALLEGRKC